MNKKEKWSKQAKEQLKKRMIETINNPKTPSSYHKKQRLLDQIPDTLPRY